MRGSKLNKVHNLYLELLNPLDYFTGVCLLNYRYM